MCLEIYVVILSEAKDLCIPSAHHHIHFATLASTHQLKS